MLRLLVIALGIFPAAARADAVANELSTGTSSGTTWIADRTMGEWDASRELAVQVAYAATRGSTWSHVASVSASYELDEQVSVSGVAHWVPAATASSQVTLPDDSGEEGGSADLLIKSSTGAVAGTVSYDTPGGATSAAFTMTVDHVAARHALTSIRGRDGEMLTRDDLRARCELHPCHPAIDAALSGDLRRLSQLSISASVVHTENDVDLGLEGSYYFHDGGGLAGASRISDVGVASVPLHYAIAPSLTHRWRTVRVTLGGSYASYLARQGEEITGSAKVLYNPTRNVQVYSSLVGTWTVDSFRQLSTSLAMAVGGKYAW